MFHSGYKKAFSLYMQAVYLDRPVLPEHASRINTIFASPNISFWKFSSKMKNAYRLVFPFFSDSVCHLVFTLLWNLNSQSPGSFSKIKEYFPSNSSCILLGNPDLNYESPNPKLFVRWSCWKLSCRSSASLLQIKL